MKHMKAQFRTFSVAIFVAVVLIALPARAQSVPETQGCQNSTVDQLGSEDFARKSRAFLAEVQSAVAKGDKAKVATMISYPLLVNGSTSKTRIKTGAQFLSHYDRIFDEHVRQAIARQSAECLFGNYQGAMIGDGEVWFNEQANGTMKIITVNTGAGKQ